MNYDRYLFKYNVYDTNFYVMPIDELPAGGFNSLYSFTEETAKTFESSTANQFKGTVWSEKLWLDFDFPEAGMAAWDTVKARGLKAELWSSGGKGYHIGIDRPHEPSHLLPYIDKEWAKVNFPRADMSIYTHLHLFRRPGDVHQKTGLRKTFVEANDGRPLVLPNILAKEAANIRTEGELAAPVESIFLNSFVMGLSIPQSEGGRHDALLRLGVFLKKIGEPMTFVERWLQHVNLLYENPKPEDEFQRLIDFIERAE